MSREWEIDQRCKVLIGKIVGGNITRAEATEYKVLQMERIKLMTPAPLRGHTR